MDVLNPTNPITKLTGITYFTLEGEMKNNGGPAFPQNDACVNRINNHDGMTLRDYFAGQALAGLKCLAYPLEYYTEKDELKATARTCYKYADAMLTERELKGVNNGQ